ncbi:MAG: hypothetical protein ACI9VS_003237 [Candidatus Binatia bacterium]
MNRKTAQSRALIGCLGFVCSAGNIAAEKQTVLPSSIWKSETRAPQIELIKRFQIFLSNGWKNFEGEELHAAGCELFIYRWFNGYYASQLDAPSDEDAAKRAQAAA